MVVPFCLSHFQDVKSYVEVDIPRSRIFTVNHKVVIMDCLQF